MAQRPKHIKNNPHIPSLNKKNHDVTSDIDPRYNCIAYAAGETHRNWWPAFHPDYYWPSSAPAVNSIASFVTAFAALGYEPCADGVFEEGYEKVALFTLNGTPTHAARQIGPDRWQSKLGQGYDIEHKEAAVSSGIYGTIEKYLKRKILSTGEQ